MRCTQSSWIYRNRRLREAYFKSRARSRSPRSFSRGLSPPSLSLSLYRYIGIELKYSSIASTHTSEHSKRSKKPRRDTTDAQFNGTEIPAILSSIRDCRNWIAMKSRFGRVRDSLRHSLIHCSRSSLDLVSHEFLRRNVHFLLLFSNVRRPGGFNGDHEIRQLVDSRDRRISSNEVHRLEAKTSARTHTVEADHAKYAKADVRGTAALYPSIRVRFPPQGSFATKDDPTTSARRNW